MIEKRTPPRCRDCGTRTERVITEEVVSVDEVNGSRAYFLCASCEYKREHPDALPAVKMPRERRALKLQTEQLF